MEIIIFVIVIALFVAAIVYMFTNAYNKLLKNKTEAEATWQSIVKELNIRFNLYSQFSSAISTTIDANTINTFNQAIASYTNKVAIEEIINDYYAADTICKTILGVVSTPEWIQAFDDSFKRIEALRTHYNDTILKINNLVKMFPTSLVAKVHGFAPWPFFRGL